MGQVPPHGSGQVARLGLKPLQRLVLACAAQRPVRLLNQPAVVVRVPAPYPVRVGTGRKPLGHERADGLQHP